MVVDGIELLVVQQPWIVLIMYEFSTYLAAIACKLGDLPAVAVPWRTSRAISLPLPPWPDRRLMELSLQSR